MGGWYYLPTGCADVKCIICTCFPLQHLGWRAVDVPFYEWYELAPPQRQRYMRRKLQQAGLQLPGWPNQQLQQPQQLLQGEGVDLAADAQLLPLAPQQELHLEPEQHQPAAQQDLVSAAGQLPPPPQEQEAVSSSEGATVPAVSATQRAQRLHLLQYRAGKLSRQGLLSRRSMQATAGSSGSSGAGNTASSSSAGGSESGSLAGEAEASGAGAGNTAGSNGSSGAGNIAGS